MTTAPDPMTAPADARGSGWKGSLLLGIGLFLVYSANLRPIGAPDTVPAMLLPVAIIRGDGPFLDRFAFLWRALPGGPPWYAAPSTVGHLVSRYPLGPALLAVPFELPQVWALDRFHPGWDRDQRLAPRYCLRMAKNTAAIIAALTAVALLQLLRRLGLGRMAWPAVLAAALGSDLWTVASQSLWQHGPAALALTLAMLLLAPGPAASRARLCLAGLATAALVAFRPIDIVFAVVILRGVIGRPGRSPAWFLPFPILGALAVIGYNYWYFGSILGGQAQLEALHPGLHGVVGTWSGRLLDGAAGTLVSPSHGLFVFSPWIAVALATMPAIAPRLRRWPLGCWLLGAIVPYFILLAKHSTWWAGHSFGPRYWTDVIPLFTVLLGFGLAWSWARCRPVFLAFVAAIGLSLGVQLLGAFCYPSTWETRPVDVDRHHERLWDWRDSELSRCWHDGLWHGSRR